MATSTSIEEQFQFTGKLQKNLVIVAVIGIVLVVIGIFMAMGGGHDAHGEVAEAAGHGATDAGDHGHAYHWTHRLFANLWINNIYFVGLALIGVLFVAIQYAAQAGWSAGMKRVPEAFGSWILIGGVLTFVLYWVTNYGAGHWHIFHWLDHSLYEEGGPNYDAIIAGKASYLNQTFFLARMVIFFAVWYLLAKRLRTLSLKEDMEGGTDFWKKSRTLSAIFIVFFALSSSMAAWDWVMSIDTHWFSTMFGWYVFASWWVAGLAFIAYIVVQLKGAGYLKVVNSNHLHDMGNFIFAFSIFWTYIWFSQFLLIYYANIPEETVYFVERWKNDHYAPIFFLNLILNFFFPFLFLIDRDVKRHAIFFKIACPVIIFGHWLDFYLMITPGTLKENGGFGFMEIGLLMIFGAAFVFVLLKSLAKAPLVAKNHPMLQESVHHHVL